MQLLEGCCDPLTQGNLDRVGVRAGWHCLEVGAGGGSVARHCLYDRVGPEGRVLAVDLEPALLEGLSGPDLEVRRLDVVADEVPAAAFDLIHTRAVLMHIPRDDVLPKLIRALRPGGVLLLEEMDVTSAYAMPEGLYVRTIHTAWDRMAEGGVDIYWGSKTAGLLEAAGLVDIGGHTDRCTFVGGSPTAKFFQISWAQLVEGRPFSDEERAIIAAGSDLIGQPGGEYVAWDFVAAWGRRPH